MRVGFGADLNRSCPVRISLLNNADGHRVARKLDSKGQFNWTRADNENILRHEAKGVRVAFQCSHASGATSLQQLTEQGRQRIEELAQRHSVSTDAVMTLLQSLVNGNGTMAQFNHRDLGGGGQWMRGGMTMVGDMFNHGLKAKIEGLCSELSQLLARQPFVPFSASFQSQSQAGPQQQQGGHVGAIRSAYLSRRLPPVLRGNGGLRN